MQIKNRQQLLIIIAASAVGLLLADNLIFTPLVNAFGRRADRIVALRKKVNDGQLMIDRERSIRDRWTHMQTNTLPDNPSVAGQRVLSAVDQWAQDSDVSILSITPQWKQDADDYMTLSCRVEASGTIATLSQFLYKMEKDPLALRLESVEMSSRDNDGQQLALGLQISGLILLPQQKTP